MSDPPHFPLLPLLLLLLLRLPGWSFKATIWPAPLFAIPYFSADVITQRNGELRVGGDVVMGGEMGDGDGVCCGLRGKR